MSLIYIEVNYANAFISFWADEQGELCVCENVFFLCIKSWGFFDLPVWSLVFPLVADQYFLGSRLWISFILLIFCPLPLSFRLPPPPDINLHQDVLGAVPWLWYIPERDYENLSYIILDDIEKDGCSEGAGVSRVMHCLNLLFILVYFALLFYLILLKPFLERTCLSLCWF